MNAKEFFKSTFKAEPFTQTDLLVCDFAESYAKQQGAEQQKRIEKLENGIADLSISFVMGDKLTALKILEQLLKDH